MIVDYIKEILIDYRNSISLENLEQILKEKGFRVNASEIISHSNFFSLFNGTIFYKKTFLENKTMFFSEFEDYIKNRIPDVKTRKDFTECLKFFIPDILFTEWINIHLERKLMIFDLLLIILIKPKRFRDKMKFYFSRLIDFYSLVTIYSSVLTENLGMGNDKMIDIIMTIEPYEEILKNHLYNVLSVPDILRIKLDQWEKEFNDIEIKLAGILEQCFETVNRYSTRIVKRVIKKEIMNFNIFYLLSRFEYGGFYDWILVLNEEHTTKEKRDLFEDLGL